jgi:hypothetical protein
MEGRRISRLKYFAATDSADGSDDTGDAGDEAGRDPRVEELGDNGATGGAS